MKVHKKFSDFFFSNLALNKAQSLVKNTPTNAGDVGSIPGSGRCPR